MGADQHVQRGHAVHIIGIAILLRQVVGHSLLLRKAVEIAARHLGADSHLRRGDGRDVGRFHRDGVGGGSDRRGGVFALTAGLLRVAAADGQHRAVYHRNGRRAAVLGVAHGQVNLILLVGRRGGHSDLVVLLRQLQGVRMGILIERGGQLTGTEAQSRQAGIVHRGPVAADVLAAVTGIHDADLIAVNCGKLAEASVGEPVVQRAHPAAAAAAVKLTQLLVAVGDLADVIALRAHSGIAFRGQGADDAVHHGVDLGVQGHVSVHQRAVPKVGVRGDFIHRVLHDDVDLAAVFAAAGRLGPHGGGD